MVAVLRQSTKFVSCICCYYSYSLLTRWHVWCSVYFFYISKPEQNFKYLFEDGPTHWVLAGTVGHWSGVYSLTPVTSVNQFFCLCDWAPPPLHSLTPTLPLTLGWGLYCLRLSSLEVIISHFLFTADSGQCGALAAQLIIAHAGPTEGMALWNTARSSQPAVRIALR